MKFLLFEYESIRRASGSDDIYGKKDLQFNCAINQEKVTKNLLLTVKT